MLPEALILFVRKPELGKVKTRIAATEGNEQALVIYTKLLQHTHAITAPLTCDKYVFYAGAIEENDLWQRGYYKLMQAGENLGDRMKAAFTHLFLKGYSRICIIGSDCCELTTSFVELAFDKLHQHDLVIGPAYDGGYYLLAMKDGFKDVFENIEWSTEKVLEQTIHKMRVQQYDYTLLPMLHDVDTIEDVPLEWINEWKNQGGSLI